MKRQMKKGFTLIELLVVIAIIGMLAGIVLASLNTARNKGSDAAIKGNLGGSRTQAELYYDTNSAYSTAVYAAASTANVGCSVSSNVLSGTAATLFADATILSAIDAARKASGNNPTCFLGSSAGGKATSWAVSVQIKQQNVVNSSSADDHWCVDSIGSSKAIDAAITSSAC